MRCHGCGRNAAWIVLVVAASCAIFAIRPAAHAADRPAAGNADSLDAAIDARLAAGEFAPARRMAAESPDAAVRDRLLARIAAAQRRDGIAVGAADTAARIADAKLRAATFDKLRAPAGTSANLAASASATAGATRASNPRGGFGGDTGPDFDALLELVTSTVAPQSWDNVGGAGSAKGFANGVYIDAEGTLRRLVKRESGSALALVHAAAAPASFELGDVKRPTRLRAVSLNRLEKAIAQRAAAGQSPDEAMRYLAGIYQLKYVFIYPETGDLIVAGPAGEWKRDGEDRVVNRETGRPVLQLDDFVVILRHTFAQRESVFGCTITPTQKGLAATRSYVAESSAKPLPAGDRARDAWLAGLRGALGKQDIEIRGIDPRTRVARVLVEADYRMKLVGLGLEEGVLGVPSYLDAVRPDKDGKLPPLDVLRWWFTLNYNGIRTNADRSAFEFDGQALQVLSENQFLEATGQRRGTGESSVANSTFAHNFTKHFAALAEKYPAYAELRNMCDIALAAALVKSERLNERAAWPMAWLGDSQRYAVQVGDAPKQVDTTLAHRVIDGKQIVAAVSGGVRIDTTRYTKSGAIKVGKTAKRLTTAKR
jgi:hypothetical protein